MRNNFIDFLLEKQKHTEVLLSKRKDDKRKCNSSLCRRKYWETSSHSSVISRALENKSCVAWCFKNLWLIFRNSFQCIRNSTRTNKSVAQTWKRRWRYIWKKSDVFKNVRSVRFSIFWSASCISSLSQRQQQQRRSRETKSRKSSSKVAAGKRKLTGEGRKIKGG